MLRLLPKAPGQNTLSAYCLYAQPTSTAKALKNIPSIKVSHPYIPICPFKIPHPPPRQDVISLSFCRTRWQHDERTLTSKAPMMD